MEVRGKDLSERLDSTLKRRAAMRSSWREVLAVSKMASGVFSQALARERPTTPKRRVRVSKAPSMSQSSVFGSM